MKYNTQNNITDIIFRPVNFYYNNKEREENIIHQTIYLLTITFFYYVAMYIKSKSKYLQSLTLQNNKLSIKKNNMYVYTFIIFNTLLGLISINLGNFNLNQQTHYIINILYITFLFYVIYLLIIEYKEGHHGLIYKYDIEYNPLNKKDLKELKNIKKKEDNKRLKQEKYKKIKGETSKTLKKLKDK